jgi:hypothetical protein
MLHRRRAPSAPALIDSLPSPACGAGLLAAHAWLANLAPSLLPSLPYTFLPTQPARCPSSPLSPFLRRRCCESKIAVPQHNLDVDTSAFDDFCPSLLRRGGVRSRLVGVLSPPTIRCFWGMLGSCHGPFVVGLIVPPLLLRCLPLHSLPSVLLRRGSGGGDVR